MHHPLIAAMVKGCTNPCGRLRHRAIYRTMTTVLANSYYWPAVLVAALAGLALFVFALLRRRGWWWKLPVALALVAGTYAVDVVRVRMSELGQSPVNALIPTTVLLQLMAPDTEWPYGIVFDRLNKAPQRHALWTWQLDKLAHWCEECIASKDTAMARRGIQIAGTIAGRGSDAAITVLARAMMHGDAVLGLLAFDSLRSMGDRIVVARAEIERIANESRDPVMLARAAVLMAMLKAVDAAK